MIELTRLNGTEFALNDELIECISENPDTTITLVNQKLYIVKESTEEIVDKILEFRKMFTQGPIFRSSGPASLGGK